MSNIQKSLCKLQLTNIVKATNNINNKHGIKYGPLLRYNLKYKYCSNLIKINFISSKHCCFLSTDYNADFNMILEFINC